MIESHLIKTCKKKIPRHTVTSLVNVHLKCPNLYYPRWLTHDMKEFFCNNNVICGMLPWEEHSLTWGNNPLENGPEAHRKDFGNDFVLDIA